jgi:hypothetical protein
VGWIYERERGRADRNGRAPAAGMPGGSPAHRARHGQGCTVGSGEESKVSSDLRRSRAGSESAWSSPGKRWPEKQGHGITVSA